MKAKKNLWFKRKKYGWGWTPVNKKGWAVVVSYIVLLVSCSLFLNSDISIYCIIIATLFLVAISYQKGESPRWQWGSNSEDT